jgi:hypothetical protein
MLLRSLLSCGTLCRRQACTGEAVSFCDADVAVKTYIVPVRASHLEATVSLLRVRCSATITYDVLEAMAP